MYHLFSQPEDILKKTNSTINQANVKLKEFNRSTSRYQKKKKNSKIHSKSSEQHEKKKNPNLSKYINPNLEKNQEKTNLELATTIQMMALPWHLFLDLGTSFSVLSIW